MIKFKYHSGIYTLTARQQLPVSMQEAWTFLSSPANLAVITPSHMGFQITSEGREKMFPGQIITYKVRPFKGVTTNWVTEITHIEEGRYFVDEQRFGPYALWHHEHWIEPIEGGVDMFDRVSYKMPLGLLGRIAESLLVRKQLKGIFSHREKKLHELFGTYQGKQLTSI